MWTYNQVDTAVDISAVSYTKVCQFFSSFIYITLIKFDLHDTQIEPFEITDVLQLSIVLQ